MSTYSDASLIFYPSGYKAGKLYSLKPTDGSGDLTFTRASSATRVNSSGLIESVATGVPRIDYTGGGCGKLLLEPQRTNLALESNTLSTAPNVVDSSTTTANVYVSPDGTQNAMRFTETTANDRHGFYQYYTVTTQAYTASIFTKQTGRRYISLSTDMTGTQVNSFFDLQTESVLTSGSGHTCSVENYGNGWLRLIVSFTASAGFHFVIWGGSPNGITNSYAGSTSISQTFYGSQVEAGSYATSYIPTTTTAVTRVGDNASKSGISSLIGQTEGTLFIDMVPTNVSGQGRYMNLYNGANNNNGWNAIISQGTTPNTFRFYGDGFDFSGGACLFGVRVKVALAYKNGVLTSAYVNGASVGTLTAVTTGKSYDTLTLGEGPFGVAGSCNVNESIIFPTALTNAELATLTTI